jgi:hypothetical protein
MDFRDIFSLSFDALKERKVRSALTIGNGNGGKQPAGSS